MTYVNLDGSSSFRGPSLDLGPDDHLHIFPDCLAVTKRSPLPDTRDGETVICSTIIEPPQTRKRSHTGSPPAGETDAAIRTQSFLRSIGETLLSILAYKPGADSTALKAIHCRPSRRQMASCANRHTVDTGFVRRIVAGGCSTVTFHEGESGSNRALFGPHVVVSLSDSATIVAINAQLPKLIVEAEGCTCVTMYGSTVKKGSFVELRMQASLELDAATTATLEGTEGSRHAIALKVLREPTASVTFAGEPGNVPSGYRETEPATATGTRWEQQLHDMVRHAKGLTASHRRSTLNGMRKRARGSAISMDTLDPRDSARPRKRRRR